MMKDGMWPLNGANKIPPKPILMDGNENTKRDPTIWVQKTVYVGSNQPPCYKYIESPTTGSESSQHFMFSKFSNKVNTVTGFFYNVLVFDQI